MEVRIEAFGDIEVARIRHVGPYNEVGPCFARLSEWAAAIGARPGRVLGIYHDDPGAVAPDSLRADACIELQTDASPPPGIVIDRIAAGRFAVYTHRGRPLRGVHPSRPVRRSSGSVRDPVREVAAAERRGGRRPALHGGLSQLAGRYRP